MLILLPNVLDEEQADKSLLPPILEEIVPKLDGIIAEREKGARRFLKRYIPELNKPILTLSEHTTDLDELIEPLKAGETWGLISDCGLPILADPGAALVTRLHKLGIKVAACPGPSSIFLALMLSGLSGQKFAFHGYLPREEGELKREVSRLAARAKAEGETQIAIETPYRTEKLLAFLLKTLPKEAHLCVAWNLTMESEGVISKKVKEWKGYPSLKKTPAVFLFR